MARLDASPIGGAGKTVGVLALPVVAGFLAAAFGIWQHTVWWPAALVATIAAAVPIGLLWNPVGSVGAMATMANVGLLAATLMSWGDRFLGAHQPTAPAGGSGAWVCAVAGAMSQALPASPEATTIQACSGYG